MTVYILRRLLLVVPTLLGISLLVFVLARLAPGDPARELLRRTIDRPPTAAELTAARHELGLDRPVPIQYLAWAGRAVRGDLGISYSTRRPVTAELSRRIPATLQLALPAAVLALVVATILGTISAVQRNRLVDQVVRAGSLAGASMPGFWLAYLLILLFSVRLSLLPVAGREQASSVILPVVTLMASPTAILTRFIRSSMLQTLGEDYVRTARAKGLPGRRVLGAHVLRNSLIPVVTAFGTSLGYLLAGAVVIESIFAWPGLGKLALDAILQRDYPVIQAFVLYTGLTFVAINLVVDLSYAVIDPRIRLGALQEGGAR